MKRKNTNVIEFEYFNPRLRSSLNVLGEAAVITIYITVFSHLILPLGCAALFSLRTSPTTKTSWILSQSFVFAYTVFIVLYGAGWSILGLYTRWAILVLTILLIFYGRHRYQEAAATPDFTLSSWWAWSVIIFWTGLLVVTVFPLYGIMSRSVPSNPVSIQSPLPAGSYVVVQGGDHPVLNHHYSISAQRHAIDFVALNSWGFRASAFLPDDLSQYEVYNTPLTAPCSGEVLYVEDNRVDRIPPDRDTDKILGNHVIIFCRSPEVTIGLAHLKQASVEVKQGDSVEAGQHVGRVGNSGNTTEPHLHVHAVDGRIRNLEEFTRKGKGIPMNLRSLDYPLYRNKVVQIE